MKKLKKIKLLELKFNKNLQANLFWIYKSSFLGSWMDFWEIRKYEFWENIKNIDWKTTAKKNELYTKKYEEERDINVYFFLDISKSMDFWSQNYKKIEILQEVFFSIAYTCFHNNDNIWGFLFDNEIKKFFPPIKWWKNIYQIIEKLEISNTQNTDINLVFKEIIKRHLKNSLIFILTDNDEIEENNFLKIASNNNKIIYINIFDVLENQIDIIWWNIAFWKENIWIQTTLKKDTITNFLENRIEKLKKLSIYLSKYNIWYLKLDNNSNIYNELVKLFKWY